MTQGKLLADIFSLFVDSGVCPKTTIREWVPLVLYLHHKGWLYAAGKKQGPVVAAAAAYRIPALETRYTGVLPTEESGEILYVPFYSHRDPHHRWTALRLLKAYLRQNRETVREVAFNRLDKPGTPRRFAVNQGRLHER